MKYLIIILLSFFVYFNQSWAQETCKVNETVVVSEQKEDVNTPTPKELEGAEIIVKTKDGKERKLKAEDFKVVKRQQQFKVKERNVIQKIECEPKIVIEKIKENKNLIALGVRKDYIDLDKSVSDNTATISREDGLVFDLSYMRRLVFDSNFGLGVGLDTNSVVRGFVGYEF